MTAPTATDVVAFLGRTGDAATQALAQKHLPVVTAMVRAYVRDRGFTGNVPGDDLAAVIVSATARLTANPAGVTAQTSGPFQVQPGVFNGWTLAELAILHRHRKRAL